MLKRILTVLIVALCLLLPAAALGEWENVAENERFTLCYDPQESQIMLKDGTHCYVPQSALYIFEDACTPGDYTKATKLSFVNSRRITSETEYMIWVSTDMQSLNVFTGYNRHWQLVKSFKCSSGMAGYATPLGSRRIVVKMPVCHSDQWDSNLQYFLSFGGSGIHKWPGGGAGENLGVRPCSHGCVRLGTNAAIWMFKHIPVNTRFLVY